MKQRPAPDRLSTHFHRPIMLLGYLLIFALALRRSYNLSGGYSLVEALSLLGIFTLLYSSEPILSRKIKAYQRLYFPAQMLLVQMLGSFREYQDTWAVLYVVLGLQVAVRCGRREAFFWWSLFAGALMATLVVEFGPISGPGRALAYTAIGAMFISYDIQYSQHEDALAESQMLLAELREAHQKLAEDAAQAEKLAAAQERNRMIQELHDAVGQKIFAIQLAAEATRLRLEVDPQRASEQINDLQEQTQAALSQMRQLIGQWRPG